MADQSYRVAHQLTNGRVVSVEVLQPKENSVWWIVKLSVSGCELFEFFGLTPNSAVDSFKHNAIDLLQDALIGTCGILAKIEATGFPAPQVGEVNDPGDEHSTEVAQ